LDLIVLVNKYSASASEILAGAIQDNHRGLVIGQRSYGKGSVQNLIPVGDGSADVKLTTALYYLPSGRCIDRQNNHTLWGVDPDIPVNLIPEETQKVLELRRKSDVVSGKEVLPRGGASGLGGQEPGALDAPSVEEPAATTEPGSGVGMPAARPVERVHALDASGGRSSNSWASSPPNSSPDYRPGSSTRGSTGCWPDCLTRDSINCWPSSLTDSRADDSTGNPSRSSADCRRNDWTGCSTGCRCGSRTDCRPGCRASSSTGGRPCNCPSYPLRCSTRSLPKSHWNAHVRKVRSAKFE
jgi:hypothetical protein